MSLNSNIPKDMVLCRWCKEPIMANDDICPRCRQHQNSKDIELSDKELLHDSTLSVVDWVLILGFQLIGICVGSRYCLKGEKIRGLKLMSYSLIVFVSNLVFFFTTRYYYKYYLKILKTSFLD